MDGRSYPRNSLSRPIARGFTGSASTGHTLATLVALEVLHEGGNAIDAGVAAGLCLNVVHPDKTTIGGVAPIVLYSSEQQRLVSISGVGRWPMATSRDAVARADRRRGHPILRSILPAAIDAWCTALERYGTFPFERVAARAVQYARDGFAVNDYLAHGITNAIEESEPWATTMQVIAPGGTPLTAGQRLRQVELAASLVAMIDASRNASGGREGGIRAARDLVYRGRIAEQLVSYSRENDGPFTMADFESFRVQEEPVHHVVFEHARVTTPGPWCQGPVLLQALGILAHHDLRSLGWGTPAYLHLVLAALDLAFADRERYYGDPEFNDVPMDVLLSAAYLAERSSMIGDSAFRTPAPPGDVGGSGARESDRNGRPTETPTASRRGVADTSYVAVADAFGNLFSATPSDTVMSQAFAPSVQGLGFGYSGRGNQSRRDAAHPAALGPWRRPRLTPMPAVVTWPDGRRIAIGTPGADAQPQAMLQVLLNMLVFGADPQTAVELPRVVTLNHEGSFFPFVAHPGTIRLDAGFDPGTRAALEGRGYRIETSSARSGSVCLAGRLEVNGPLVAAADPRLEAVALAS